MKRGVGEWEEWREREKGQEGEKRGCEGGTGQHSTSIYIPIN